MDTTLLLYLDDEWRRVDIYEDLPISLTLQELDITDFQTRKASYTKTFTVPSTNNNATLFEHYYEVNGTEFNPLVKIPAVVQYRGTDIFNGVCRLNSVIINSTSSIDFEVYLMSDVGDFVSELKNLKLRDLDYTDLLHDLNYENVTLSWEAKDNDTDGLFGGQIVYPMINTGLLYQQIGTGQTADWSYTFGLPSSFDDPTNPVPPTAFKPAIRLSSLISRVFDQTNYELQSDFFNTDYFKSIYISLFNNGQIGLGKQSAEETENLNIFLAEMNQRTIYYEGNRTRRLVFSDRFPGAYDPLNNFYNTNNGTFQVPYQGQYYFNLRFNYRSLDPIQITGSFNIVVKKSNNPADLINGALVYQSPKYQLGIYFGGFHKGEINLFFDGYFSAGEYIGIFIEEYNPPTYIGFHAFGTPKAGYIISPYKSGIIEDDFIKWDLYNGPVLGSGSTVNVNLGVPDMQAVDLIKDVTTLFNLVVIQDDDTKKIKMEPYNWYYNDEDRQEKDWTQKLDLNSTYKIEPLSFDLSKVINFTYDAGSDEYLNLTWEDQNDYNFGRYRFVSDSNLLTGENNYSVKFIPTPTSGVTNAPNFIIPMTYRLDSEVVEAPYQNKPHIFFWLGNRYAYLDAYKQQQGSWYMLSGNTAVEWTTYPAVSHLSSLDVQVPELVSDLSFGSDVDFFNKLNPQPVVFTSNNLYNLWWRDYIENNYSNETRRLSGRFFTKPIDVYETKFTDKIFVKDSFYRLEKMSDANIVDNSLTQVSLIKERSGYYRTTPPAPYYYLEPNEPYPGISYATPFTAYTGTTITGVCDGTNPTTELISMGTLPLTNLRQVWYDTGLGYYAPFTIGTYIRQVGDTNTYLIIDKQGRILEQDC